MADHKTNESLDMSFINKANILIEALPYIQRLWGKTVVINSQEIPEIQRVADRCAVFYSGRIVKILNHEEITEHTVMMYATNAIEALEEK